MKSLVEDTGVEPVSRLDGTATIVGRLPVSHFHVRKKGFDGADGVTLSALSKNRKGFLGTDKR